MRIDDPSGEALSRVSGRAFTPRFPAGEYDPDMPVGSNVVVPVPVEFQAVGLHRVVFAIDGSEAWSAPLKIVVEQF